MADAQKGAAILDAHIQRKPKLQSPLAHADAVKDLHVRGMPSGEKTGWANVDELYTVAVGQMTVVTGWPGSGKSEWLDALLLNLSKRSWKFAMFSFENQPVSLHVTKFIEKLADKPFGEGPRARVTPDEVTEYLDELAQSFAFTDVTSGTVSVKDCLDAAASWLSPHEKRGIVIDPWNELEHWRPTNLSETEYISQTLSMVRSWARINKTHVWIVAHPQKVPRPADGKLPIPKPDMISGSQHWWNKADACVTVYRDFNADDPKRVEIHVQKIRFKHIGRIGKADLLYDRVTGRYRVPLEQVQKDAGKYRRAFGDD